SALRRVILDENGAGGDAASLQGSAAPSLRATEAVGWRATDAAMHDAFAAHALDFDDVHEHAAAHLSAVVVPALFAAESLGVKRVDAESSDSPSTIEFAEGYAAACQAAAALAIALPSAQHYANGWHNTATIGTPAAAVGV